MSVALYLVKIPYEGSVCVKALDYEMAAREAVQSKWINSRVDVTVEVRREKLRKDPWRKVRVTSEPMYLFMAKEVGT